MAKRVKHQQSICETTKRPYRRMAIFFLLILTIIGARIIPQWIFFPVKTVVIKGDYTLADQENLQQLLLPYVSKGFFAVSVSTVKERLEQVDWIKSSQVSKSWPDKLVITVQQQQAVARWNKTALISANGRVFHRSEEDGRYRELPLLEGSDSQHAFVVSNYLAMQALLRTANLTINELYLDKQNNWHCDLNNNIYLVMKKDQSMASLKKFVQAYQRILYQKADSIDYIDLRYENGVAVRWKKRAG